MTEIVGKEIVDARKMTEEELEREGWRMPRLQEDPVALELDDGTIIYPSRDPEGNGPGSLFGFGPGGPPFSVHVKQ